MFGCGVACWSGCVFFLIVLESVGFSVNGLSVFPVIFQNYIAT